MHPLPRPVSRVDGVIHLYSGNAESGKGVTRITPDPFSDRRYKPFNKPEAGFGVKLQDHDDEIIHVAISRYWRCP